MPDEEVPPEGIVEKPKRGRAEHVFSGKTCKDCGGSRVKSRVGGGDNCLDCQPKRARARDAGQLPKRTQVTKPEAFKRNAKIAALAGAGIAPRAIAKKLGMTHENVEHILRRTVKKNPDLQKILQRARDEIAEDAIEVAKLAVKTMKEGLGGYNVSAGLDRATGQPMLARVDCPPDKAAVVFREMRPAIGMSDGAGKNDGVKVQLNIDANNPEVAAAIVRALRDGSSARASAAQAVIETSRSDK